MSLISRAPRFDLDTLFDNFFNPARAEESSFFAPRVDIQDNKDHYLISAELPGVKKEDINISLDQGVLTLEAEVKQEHKEEQQGKVVRQERRYGKVMRSFTLGNAVNEQDISAKYNDGVLTIHAPKQQERMTESRRININ